MSKQEGHLHCLIEQWNAEQVVYQDDSTSEHYRLLVENRDSAQRQSDKNLSQQHRLHISLDRNRQDLEQIVDELKHIFHHTFSGEHDACREYFILLDGLHFDLSIENAQHSFLRV